MKLSLAAMVAASLAEPVKFTSELANVEAKATAAEIALGARSDGNALLISQMLEFYLTVIHGLSRDQVDQMLSYGCYCQLLTSRKIGVGSPVDKFDEICKKYQQCTRCVRHDQEGNTIQTNGEERECNWENGRYEISFVQGQDRIDCTQNLTQCGIDLCKCDEELAWEIASNTHLFQPEHSSLNGFEFAEVCPNSPSTGPGPGHGNRGNLECCGEYPHRFPYHDMNGSRKCCKDKNVYNSDESKCCPNGSIAARRTKCT